MEPPGRPGQRGGGSNPTDRAPSGQAARLGEAAAETRAGPSRGHREASDVPEGGDPGRGSSRDEATTRGDATASKTGGVRRELAPMVCCASLRLRTARSRCLFEHASNVAAKCSDDIEKNLAQLTTHEVLVAAGP